MTPTHLAVVTLCALACAWDLRTRRIPNWLTFGGAALGLLVAGMTGGLSGLAHGAGGWVTGLAMFLPFFLLRGLGAGDVKLLAAIGAWLGAMTTVWVGLFTMVAGGVLAVVVALASGYLRQAFSNVWLLLAHWRVAGIKAVPEISLEHSTGPRLAYAVPILAGTVVTLWLR
jgi:prepilin peptidase CpaA